MRPVDGIIAAVVSIGALSATATAQTIAPSAPAPSAAQAPTGVLAAQARSHWTAAGFAGSSFAPNTATTTNIDDSASFDFGGQLGYLWRGVVGAEGLAAF